MRVALVSCVKSKRATPLPARDLYTSPLFHGLRTYAERHADRWYILSAKHGLLDPDRVTAPYEQTLNTMGAAARRRWADRVNATLAERLPEEADLIILAGVRYREHVVPFLKGRGHTISIPLEGLSFGRQLAYLSNHISTGTRVPGARAASEQSGRGALPAATFEGARDGPLARLSSRAAVLQAIAECDRLGRDAFLEKYGYGPARRYFLEHKSRRYDSKAIVGVAFGFQFPDEGPLANTQFSGGASTVQRKLEELGFSVAILP
jgi:hypothetical protein